MAGVEAAQSASLSRELGVIDPVRAEVHVDQQRKQRCCSGAERLDLFEGPFQHVPGKRRIPVREMNRGQWASDVGVGGRIEAFSSC